MAFVSSPRRVGAALAAIGCGALGVGVALGGPGGLVVAASTDPGCTASTAGPGVVVVCLHEDQEKTTAGGFATQSCDNISGRDPSLDYFVFVLPDAGDPGRVFVGPAPSVMLDSATIVGTIGSDARFFYAAAAPGSVLLEASAHADNGSGTPTGGEAQVFNLTHTCPATAAATSSSSSSSTSSTESSSTSTVTTSSSTTTSSTGTSSTSSGTGTTTTTTSSVGGGVLGISTTATPSGGAAGLGAAAPDTGAASGWMLVGVGMVAAGGALIVVVGTRRRLYGDR